MSAPRRGALVSAMLLATACAERGVSVDDAWIRTPPPGVTATAAYLTLHNGLPEAVTLTGAASERFAQVMIHETVVREGMTRMVHATPLEVAPGATVEFAPGGLHLMLMQPRSEIAPGERIAIVLEFAGQRPVRFDATVSGSSP